MKHVTIKLIGLKKIIPAPIKSALKFLGFDNLVSFLFNTKKYTTELAFQMEWAREFKDNRSKVLEYWKKYRYLDDMDTICKITEDTRVLDVGCGISTVLHYIKGKRFGIDPLADEYLKLYEYPKEINIKKAFGEDIPFSDKYFDVIFCSNVLDHVTNPQKIIDEIHRVLKPSGHFLLTVEIFEEKTMRDPAHPHSLTKEMVYLLLEGRFKRIFERESPWMGLRAYVNGSRESRNKELITILKKCDFCLSSDYYCSLSPKNG